jgi:dsDNA-specific endonuclease/ATPase MutS2
MKFAIALAALMISSNVFAANSKCTEGLTAIRVEIAKLNAQSDSIESNFEAGKYRRADATYLLIELSKKRMDLREQRMALIASDICH